MMLNEKLLICESVISALRTQSDMVSMLSQLPMEHQLVGVGFMEFLKEEADKDDIKIKAVVLDS